VGKDLQDPAASSPPAGGRRAPSQAEKAYETLKERIVLGEYAPGVTIPEPELAQALQMSRTPLREALVRLEHDGLVTLVPRRGMRVKPLSARDLQEISELLACLECEAAERLAMRRLDASELQRLDSAIEAMDAALERDDMAAWAAADYTFHRLLIELHHNRHLAEVALSYLEKAHRFRLLAVPHRARPVYSNVNHAAVVEAIRRGDPQSAVDIHRAHKRRWARELNDLMPRLGAGSQ
jgi:DNA-binding GntR family transcriptional regulator